MLGRLESWQVSRHKDEPGLPPVFIIGAPRSGTTLLYQVMAARFQVAYSTNFLAMFYKASILGMALSQKLHGGDSSEPNTFQSHHGSTAGHAGPYEAGEFWYRWFPRGWHIYVAPELASFGFKVAVGREGGVLAWKFTNWVRFQDIMMNRNPICESHLQ